MEFRSASNFWQLLYFGFATVKQDSGYLHVVEDSCRGGVSVGAIGPTVLR